MTLWNNNNSVPTTRDVFLASEMSGPNQFADNVTEIKASWIKLKRSFIVVLRHFHFVLAGLYWFPTSSTRSSDWSECFLDKSFSHTIISYLGWASNVYAAAACLVCENFRPNGDDLCHCLNCCKCLEWCVVRERSTEEWPELARNSDLDREDEKK